MARRLLSWIPALFLACGGASHSGSETVSPPPAEVRTPETAPDVATTPTTPTPTTERSLFVPWRSDPPSRVFGGLAIVNDRAYTVATGVYGPRSELVEVLPDGRARSVAALEAERCELYLCDRTADGTLVLCGNHEGDLRVGGRVIHPGTPPKTGVVVWMSAEGAVLRTHTAGYTVARALAMPDGGSVVVSHPRHDQHGDDSDVTVQFLDAAGQTTQELTWPMRNAGISAAAVTREGAVVIAGAAEAEGTIDGRPISIDRHVGGFVARVLPSGEVSHLLAPRGSRANVLAIAQTGSDLYLVGSFRGRRVSFGDTHLRSTSEDDDGLVWVVDATTLEHRSVLGLGGTSADELSVAIVMPSGRVRALGGFSPDEPGAVDALLEDGWREGCILDLELAADGSVARARRRYPNRVASNYPETYLYSAGLWGDHLVLVGTTDSQSTFLDAPPPRPGEYQTPFFVIEPTSPRAESTRAQ